MISPKIEERIFHYFITGGKAEYIHVDADEFRDFKVERQGSSVIDSVRVS